MRKSVLLLTAALMELAAPVFAEDATGIWSGSIDNHLLSLIRIQKTSDGSYTGTFTDHEQPLGKPDDHAVTDVPISHILATPDHLSFEVTAIGGALFDGEWDNTARQWAGTFQWGKDGYRSQLRLKRTDATALAAAFPEDKPRVYASPAEEAAEMEKLIDGYMKDDRFMGAILVSQNGQNIIDKGYGYADLATETPNRPDTSFEIASITKSFTATAILMLQDRGRFSIDDPIGKYIENTPNAWDGITLRHLLTHMSGLGDYNPLIAKRYGEDMTPAQIVDIIRGMPLDSRPGEKYQYSNAGYALLGAVIEKTSGQSYGDFLRENIFVPLHMDATAYNPAARPDRALGYLQGDEAPTPAPARNLSNTFATGGIVSTTHDLLKWQEGLFDGHLISAKALAEMMAQNLGIVHISADAHMAYMHSGHLPGFVSNAAYEPEGRLAINVFGNLDNSSPIWISTGLATIAHGYPAEVVPMPQAIAVAPEILAQYVGTYVLMPNFSLTVTLENGHLMVQATDQEKVSAFPESETMFFAKIVEAKLEFVRDKDGQISCILHQAGRDIPGVRQ